MEFLPLALMLGIYFFIIRPALKRRKNLRKSARPSGQRRRIEPEEFDTDVVGESHYQDNLLALCGGRSEEGAEKLFFADVIPESKNKHDKNAVRVDIDGKTVGYLSRTDAASYRSAYEDEVRRCAAIVLGGWDRGNGDVGHFGVRLNLDLD